MLQRPYEQLIMQAALDPAFAARLLADPAGAAREAGYSEGIAESLVGLGRCTLAEFAAALHRRVYESSPAGAPASGMDRTASRI